MPAWLTLRNIVIGTGLVIIWSQLVLWIAVERTPSDGLMALGVTLLPLGVASHVRTILGAQELEAGPSSPSSPPPSSSPSSPSSPPAEVAGE